MKLEILKSIVSDLHLAGIHDIPANDFMDAEKIDSQELIKAVFNNEASPEINALLDSETFNESSIANEMSELFAALGTGQRAELGAIETIATTAPKQTKALKEKTIIVDPRLKQNKPSTNSPAESIKDILKSSASKIKALSPDFIFKPTEYISSNLIDDAKLVLVLPYKNKQSLKTKADFNLLVNILKSIGLDFDKTSTIFIDNSYKNITQGLEKYDTMLAQALEKELKYSKQTIILSFGEDCLNLTKPGSSTIRTESEKVLDVFESKKLLANYSLSAMVNTPKYKATTWTNLLLINKI